MCFRCFVLEPLEFFLFFGGIHRAIDVSGLADERVGGFVLVLGLLLVGIDHGLKHGGNLLGADFVGASFVGRGLRWFDHLAERDGAFHRVGVGVWAGGGGEIGGNTLFAECFPAADDAGGVIHFKLVVFILEQVLESFADVGGIDLEDDHFGSRRGGRG